MSPRSRSIRIFVCVAGVAAAGCQGSSGTSGLTIPQTGAYGNPQGPSSGQSVSRQQTLDGTTEIDPATSQIVLPAVGGFSIAIDAPAPAAADGASAAVASPPASGAASAVPGASPAAAGSPSPSPSSSPSAVPAASVSPSPAANASSAPSTKSAKGGHAAAKIVTKLVIYPDKGETAPTPTPEPSGSPLPSIIARTELVRGNVSFATSLSIAGLAAVHVTIPAAEQVVQRGFTLAVYRASGKKHRTLVAFDSAAVLTKDVVRGSVTTPIAFEKGADYAIELFGDPLPATPAPAGSYPTPGNNPFAPPSGSATGVPGMPNANPNGATALPAAPATATPYP